MLAGQVKNRLEVAGYRQMKADMLPFGLWVRKEEEKTWAVCLVERPEEYRNHPMDLWTLTARVKYALEKQYGLPCDILVLVLSGDIAADKNLVEGSLTVWLIGPDGSRIVFDGQPGSFDGLEYALEPGGRLERPEWKVQFPWVTAAIVLANVLVQLLVSILNVSSGSSFFDAGGGTWLMETMELPIWTVVYEKSGYYRLLTSVFLHYGWPHLLNNMVVLFYLGKTAEEIAGKWRYAAAYLVCGVGANVISVAWYWTRGDVFVTTAGASGAVFGVAGMMLAWVLLYRGRIEGIGLRQLILMMIFTVYHGMTEGGVNNAAHVGGAVLGVLCGLAVWYGKRRHDKELSTNNL